MVIQTDADGTIYRGNLLVSLGWIYARFLFQEKKYFSLFGKLIKLPFFYFLSHLPFCMGAAFVPFEGCPFELVKKIKKPVREKWLKIIEKINPEKIIIISRQEKNLLLAFISNSPELKKYKIEVISNIADVVDKKFTGKFKIIIRPYQKEGYVDENLIYLGDLRDFVLWGRKKNKFILV
jgi:hypothetical protein